MDLPDTRLWRDDPRPKAGSPLIVIPIAPSVPSCSKLSRCGLAKAEQCRKVGATANLDSSSARRRKRSAGSGRRNGLSDRTKKLTKKKRCATLSKLLDKPHTRVTPRF